MSVALDITRGHDSFFGPPSEPISIRGFLDDTGHIDFPSSSDVLKHVGWQNLSEDERAAVEAECSVTELKATAEEVWDNPILSAHLSRRHAAAVNAIHSQAGGPVSKSRKRKHRPEPDTLEGRPEVRAFQEKLDAISLRCWGLNEEAALFMRATKHSDLNALKHVKKSGHGMLNCDQSSTPSLCPTGTNVDSTSTLSTHPSHRDALVTLTVHNRVSWAHGQLVRLSQHVVLSSQTLGDFVRAIPCDSNEMPTEVTNSQGNVVGYTYDNDIQVNEAAEGCVLLIDDVAYGDGLPGNDYAAKLHSHLQGLQEEKRPQIITSPTSLSETLFMSLTLRINQPYWMLHQGNCEHFVIVDEIRLAHPPDTPSGYPLTVYIAPAVGDFCRACAKVPAVLTVVGDVRLGESPCLLCAPCWRNMGPPREEDAEQLMVVPLVRHCKAWEDGMDA